MNFLKTQVIIQEKTLCTKRTLNNIPFTAIIQRSHVLRDRVGQWAATGRSAPGGRATRAASATATTPRARASPTSSSGSYAEVCTSSPKRDQ